MFKGKAHGIVPHLPHLNTVAIKTAVSTGRFLPTTVYYIISRCVASLLYSECDSPAGPEIGHKKA